MTQTSPPPTHPLPLSPSPPVGTKNWLQDLSVGNKQFWTALAPALISILGIGGFGTWLLQQHQQTNLLNQAKSELEIISSLPPEQLQTDLERISSTGYTAIYSPQGTETLEPDLAKILQAASQGNIATGKANIKGVEQLLAAKSLPNKQILVRSVPNPPLNLGLLLGLTGVGIGLNLVTALLLKKYLTQRIELLNQLVSTWQPG